MKVADIMEAKSKFRKTFVAWMWSTSWNSQIFLGILLMLLSVRGRAFFAVPSILDLSANLICITRIPIGDSISPTDRLILLRALTLAPLVTTRLAISDIADLSFCLFGMAFILIGDPIRPTDRL